MNERVSELQPHGLELQMITMLSTPGTIDMNTFTCQLAAFRYSSGFVREVGDAKPLSPLIRSEDSPLPLNVPTIALSNLTQSSASFLSLNTAIQTSTRH